MKKQTITFRANPKKIKALDRLARSLDRDRSYLLNAAVDQCLSVHAHHVEEIEKGLQEARSGKLVDYSDVMAGWLNAKEIERAALADPDAQPLTESDLKRMKRTPRAKIIRRALDLSQEEFATRYQIPLGTLRDWEQGRATPDQPTQAYLTLIAREPKRVEQILKEPLPSRR